VLNPLRQDVDTLENEWKAPSRRFCFGLNGFFSKYADYHGLKHGVSVDKREGDGYIPEV